MRQNGKYGTKWQKTRQEWVKLNPPNHEGYYICYICGVWIPANELTVDHIRSRSRAPQLRFEINNLAPACSVCNTEKGSTEFVKASDEKYEFSDGTDDIW